MSELGVKGTRDRGEEIEHKCRLHIFYVFLWTCFVLFTLFYFDDLLMLIYYKWHGNNFYLQQENVTKQIHILITKQIKIHVTNKGSCRPFNGLGGGVLLAK
jgi:hypothetical protein